MMMKARVALCVSLVALVAVVQVIELRDRMQRTELGEDADFDVKTWRLGLLLHDPRLPLLLAAAVFSLF
jgi:hypothetical protein